jgi:putative NADH-flavin reductase
MAKLVVFGASGATGREVVFQALRAGHAVTAFVRTPATAGLPDGARVLGGDVLDAPAVEAALAGQDVVVSALGHRRTSKSPFAADLSPPDLFTRATTHVLAGMRRHRVGRILVVGIHGCGDSRARTSAVYRWLVERTTIGLALADANAMEQQLAGSGLEWLVSRPVSLTNGAGRGRWRIREDRIGSFATIARADVAAHLLAHVDGAIAARTPSLSS